MQVILYLDSVVRYCAWEKYAISNVIISFIFSVKTMTFFNNFLSKVASSLSLYRFCHYYLLKLSYDIIRKLIIYDIFPREILSLTKYFFCYHYLYNSIVIRDGKPVCCPGYRPVSYTHLTLPTICSV